MTDTTTKPKLKLLGRDGNAFAIIGAVIKAGRKAGWDRAKIEAIQTELMGGDYDHLLQTCMKHFDVE